jgi:hypothetical protein
MNYRVLNFILLKLKKLKMTKVFKILITVFFVNFLLYFIVDLLSSFYFSFFASKEKFFKLFVLFFILSFISNFFLIASNFTKYYLSNYWIILCFIDFVICFLIYSLKTEFLFVSVLIFINSFVYFKIKTVN